MSDLYQLPTTFSSYQEMLDEFSPLQNAFTAELNRVQNAEQLEQFRIRWFGDKRGIVNKGVPGWIKTVPAEKKPEFGGRSNHLRDILKSFYEDRLRAIQLQPEFDRIWASSRYLDVSLPGLRRRTGVEHPLTRTMREISSVFAALGYSVGTGPEVESDFYNFEALNFPPNHPARDTQDTLVVAGQEAVPRGTGC